MHRNAESSRIGEALAAFVEGWRHRCFRQRHSDRQDSLTLKHKDRTCRRLGNRLAAISLMGALSLGACGPGGPVDITEWRPLIEPPLAFLENTNLRIEAVDGSFVIEGGEQFEPPFYTHLIAPECSEDVSFLDEAILNGYAAALDCGAKEVRVFVDGDDRPLYGVLAFGRILPSAKGPVKRSYLLRIPSDKLRSAVGGLTTVTYEKYDYEVQWSDGQTKEYNWRAWILWLSNTPLR